MRSPCFDHKSLGGRFGLCLPVPQPDCAMDTSLPASPTPMPEAALWEGHTSQWVHFWYYLFCLVLVAGCLAGIPFTAGLSAIGLVVPLIMWIVRWWATRATKYELTSQRLRKRSGIFS